MTAPPADPDADGGSPGPGADLYAGLATRTLAFALDAALINVTVWFVGLVVALGLSLLKVPDEVRTLLAAIGAGLALVWTVLYFTFFWSTTGQTPGNRVMRIRVRDAKPGGEIRARRAVLRVGALMLSALPLCAGFLLILVDRRRRALHDRLVRTEVVYVAPTRRSPGPGQPGEPSVRVRGGAPDAASLMAGAGSGPGRPG